ncbi:MAG: hypothetical protein FJX77_14325, partial [Armatimonadetes bacterium]|nr:hypothetical protein [Armatimonadota bacterium]
MIPETELNEILARGRAALARAAARPPGCFPIPRRVELALNESLWTAAERAHAAECPRCSHAVDHLRRRIEHP